MKLRKSESILLVMAVGSLLASFYLYPQLPDCVASHWNIRGEIDGYVNKSFGLFFMPIFMFIQVFIFLILPRIKRIRFGLALYQKHYDNFTVLFLLFFLSMHLFVLLSNKGFFMHIGLIVCAWFSLFSFLMGNFCAEIQRNAIAGIRTPWTLQSDVVWEKTHKLGARLFKKAGAGMLVGLFFPDYALFFITIPLLLVGFSVIAYSYFEYQKEIKKTR